MQLMQEFDHLQEVQEHSDTCCHHETKFDRFGANRPQQRRQAHKATLATPREFTKTFLTLMNISTNKSR